MITHLCTICAGPVDVARVDVTTWGSGPRFMWGRWDRCATCGSTAPPMQVVDANAEQLNAEGCR